jgi:Acetyltransferase (GNAT) domain
MTDPLLALHHETGVRIRKATLADRDALIELTRVVFAETGAEKGAELGPEFWEWQFTRQPTGRTDIWIGELNGQIIVQIPTNVVRLKWGNREVLAAWVIDLVVHPAHRDKSLFIRVGRFSNKEMGETGISLSLGLPNKKSFPAAIRFVKHHLVSQVPVLVLPIRWSRLLERVGIPAWASRILGPLASVGHRLISFPTARAKGIEVREVSEFPESMDDFWQRASAPHKIISIRDEKYLTWRFRDCPTRSYKILIAEGNGELAGYLVYRVFEKDGLRMGALMDMLVEPGRRDVLNALLSKAIAELRAARVDAIMALMVHDRLYFPALRRLGFAKLPERFNPRTFNLVCRELVEGLPQEEATTARNWFITLGDFDVY